MIELEIIRGDTETLSFVFTDENEEPFDLTDGTIFFTIKDISDNSDSDNYALITKEQTVHTDAVNGLSEIELSATETRELLANEYKADIQFIGSDSKIKSTKEFKVFVFNDVTKRTS